MSTISVCIVVRNEEAVLDRCLDSVADVVDEIVLIHDGPCADRTLEIAAAYGCRTIVGEFAGMCEPHRPLAFSLARGEWVLRIDADEFLSDGLRAALPGLAARTDVDGFEFIWPVWKHEAGRYVTRNGPYKLALTRRSSTRRSALAHAHTEVRGRVERVPLILEHRPLYDNYCLQTFRTKWRRWARIHARMYLMRRDEIPEFGSDPDTTWPRRRIWGNYLSPILVLPYGLVELVVESWWLRRMRPVSQIARIAGWWALYAMMVQVYVVRYLYVERSAGQAPAGMRPAHYSPAQRPDDRWVDPRLQS